MTTPTRNTKDIVDSIISFLFCEGYDIPDTCHAELAARVEGHADLKAQESYKQKWNQHLVYELGLDDVGGPHQLLEGLKDTLSKPVLGSFDNFADAEAEAQKLAVRLSRPIIVLNGLHHVMGVCDEPVEKEYPYSVYRPLGLLNPGAAFVNSEFSEDLDLVDACLRPLRYAVGVAVRAAYHDATSDSPNPVVVVEEEGRRVLWRSKSLRA